MYISFSGGKDSTVLLDLARRIYPDVLAVFINTGLEYPEIIKFVKTFDNVIWLRPEMNFKKVIMKYGYPLVSKEVSEKIQSYRNHPDRPYAKARFDPNSNYAKKYGARYIYDKWIFLRDSNIPISNKCCFEIKKKPIKKFEKGTGMKPIMGMMANESATRKTNWLRNGCNAFDVKRPSSNPLAFWTEQDVYEYIVRFIKPKYDEAWHDVSFASGSKRKKARNFLRKHNYTKTGIATVYGDIVQNKKGKYSTTGAYRTGCIFCGYGAQSEKEPNRFQKLKVTHPKLWSYCMKPIDKGGLGMKEPLEFIGVKTE